MIVQVHSRGGERHVVILYYSPHPWTDEAQRTPYTFVCLGAKTYKDNYAVDLVMHSKLPNINRDAGRVDRRKDNFGRFSGARLRELLTEKLSQMTELKVRYIPWSKFMEVSEEYVNGNR